MTADTRPGLGVYVHWPFCAAKCPYCDFNSHVRGGIDQDRWARALCRELDWMAAQSPDSRVESIFFGGGTPSLMAPATVAAVIDRVAALWPVADGAEITLEANPTSVEAARFAGYASAGVNRVSIGVQALNDADLRALGRLHSAAEALAAFDVARRAFARVSFDLIYARQHQTAAAWEAELRSALGMAVDHLSLYQLTIEEGTAFGARHAAGRLAGLPDQELSAELFEITQEICEAAGLPAYEVSNHARPGAGSRHNLVYWRGEAFAGVGPGAHGRIGASGARRATETARMPEVWLSAVEHAGHGLTVDDPVPAPEEAEEYLMMSLRLTEGSDLSRFAALAGREVPAEAVAELEDAGLLTRDGHRLRTTAAGRLVLNGILRQLLA